MTGPVLSLHPSSKPELHPLDLVGIKSDELLPAGTSAALTTDGAAVSLTALPASGLGVSGFLLEGVALAFASSYKLAILPEAVDLVGNPVAHPATFKTTAGPGFFAQDGFEGAVEALFGGQVKVIDDSSLPVPSGTKAIRFAPITSDRRGDTSCDDRFTARLAVGPSAKAVKLSVLTYAPRSSWTSPFMGWLRLAVPNGSVYDAGTYWTVSEDVKPLPSPWSGPLPGSETNEYDTLSELEIPLPDGVGSEVIFDLYRMCTEPMLSSDGLVLDDLRVE